MSRCRCWLLARFWRRAALVRRQRFCASRGQFLLRAPRVGLCRLQIAPPFVDETGGHGRNRIDLGLLGFERFEGGVGRDHLCACGLLADRPAARKPLFELGALGQPLCDHDGRAFSRDPRRPLDATSKRDLRGRRTVRCLWRHVSAEVVSVRWRVGCSRLLFPIATFVVFAPFCRNLLMP